jgi:hypothetical protein
VRTTFFASEQSSKSLTAGLCPALSYFLGIDNNGTKTIENNNSNFCPMLQKTCCSKKDFSDLKKWWESSILYPQSQQSKWSSPVSLSRLEMRTRKLEDIASYTWEMLNMVKELRKRARLILMADKSDATCQRASERFLLYRFREENYKDFLKKAENCWQFTNNIQTKVLCDVCDPEAQGNLSLQKDAKIFINLKAKSQFETSCLDMIRTNLTFVFPYLEVLEPLVRCNLDGKKTTKDRLRLRRSDRIWDTLEDGMTEEMVTYGLSFGEEVNLNSEGDARFVTFLFRNVKEFLEQNIGGAGQKQLDQYIKSKNKRDWSSFTMDDQSITNSLHDRRLKMISDDKKSLANFAELDKQEKIQFNDLLNALSKRILIMKRSKRSDYDINSMISQTKTKYSSKLSNGNIAQITEFNSTEESKYHDLGAGGRMMIKDDRDVLDYSQELQRSPDIYADIKNKLKSVDENAKNDFGRQLQVQTNDDQVPELPVKDFLRDKPDDNGEKVRQRELWMLHEGQEKNTKKEGHESLRKAQQMRNRNLLSEDSLYSNVANTFDTNGRNLIKMQEKLARNSFSLIRPGNGWDHAKHSFAEAHRGSLMARRLAKSKDKKEKSKEEKVTAKTMKHKLQLKCGLWKRKIEDEWDNGHEANFKNALQCTDDDDSKLTDCLRKKTKKGIACVNPKKTNLVANHVDYFQFADEGSCLDCTDKIHKKWCGYIDECVKWPKWSGKKKASDVLKEGVLKCLETITDNLDDKGNFSKPKEDDERRARRLQSSERRLKREDPVYADRRLNEQSSIDKDERNTLWDNDTDRNIDENGETLKSKDFLGTDDEEEAHKIAMLEHKMSKKLSSLFKSSAKKKSNRVRDTISFVVDGSKGYDMWEGLGKTGFRKIDFSEERILREMAVYHRIDNSIKMHTDWFKCGGVLRWCGA